MKIAFGLDVLLIIGDLQQRSLIFFSFIEVGCSIFECVSECKRNRKKKPSNDELENNSSSLVVEKTQTDLVNYRRTTKNFLCFLSLHLTFAVLLIREEEIIVSLSVISPSEVFPSKSSQDEVYSQCLAIKINRRTGPFSKQMKKSVGKETKID